MSIQNYCLFMMGYKNTMPGRIEAMDTHSVLTEAYKAGEAMGRKHLAVAQQAATEFAAPEEKSDSPLTSDGNGVECRHDESSR